MLFPTTTAQEKRQLLQDKLKQNTLLQFPGAFSPLVSMLIEELGFDGIYISGAVLSNDLALPDVGLTTLTEVSLRGRSIARASCLPSIIDVDTGFGEPMNLVRSIQELTELGLSGCHLEDQVNPKRCGHLDNKSLVSVAEMTKKIKAATNAKTDSNFLLIARTDSRSSEGFSKAVDRAKAYMDAGADMIFPEALQSEKEFEDFKKQVDAPIMANMTEFGKSPLLTKKQLENMGYSLVIYPVTTLRLAMKAVEEGLQHIKTTGDQKSIVSNMQERKRLYEILKYKDYESFDKSIFNFDLKNNKEGN
ncbi:MAG: methylisocitrate lyase [Bdellovibrionaceae bacterium]|nr:methylisocitrate lyase [Pseudobdellovibrionaceae bacterium]